MKTEIRLYFAELFMGWALRVAPEGDLKTLIYGYFQNEVVKTWKKLHNPPQPPRSAIYPQMVNDVVAILEQNGYKLFTPIAVEYGHQIKTFSGGVVTVYITGRIIVQGKPDERLKQLFK